MAAIINHERFGQYAEFETLAEAQQAIRNCGPEFASVTLEVYGDDIHDAATLERVGRIEDRPAVDN